MNISLYNDSLLQATQNEASITLFKSQTGAYVLWVIFGTLNTTAAILTILTFAFNKHLHSDTHILSANLAVCEIGMSLSSSIPAIYHLYNIYNRLPEVKFQTNCFWTIFCQVAFGIMLPAFHLALCFDRFIAAIFPHYYKNRNRHYVHYISALVWLVSPCLAVTLYSTVSSSTVVVQCLLRNAMSATAFNNYNYLVLTLSMLSVGLYIFFVLTLQIQVRLFKHSSGNVAEIGNRMRNKVTRSLAIAAVLQFITFTGSLLSTLAITAYSSNPVAINPYFTTTRVLGGLTSFIVYYMCQNKFREGFQLLFKTALAKFTKNQVENICLVNLGMSPSRSDCGIIQLQPSYL